MDNDYIEHRLKELESTDPVEKDHWEHLTKGYFSIALNWSEAVVHAKANQLWEEMQEESEEKNK